MHEPSTSRCAALVAICLVLLAGCAGGMQAQPAAGPPPAPFTVDAALAGRISPAAEVPAFPELQPAEDAAVPAKPADVAIPAKPAAPAPARVVAPKAAAPAVTKAAALPAATAEPTLDIPDLRARLRKTQAIGMFAKLAIEKEVDELLERFDALYRSGKRAGAASLRQPFDTLVQKVIGMIKEGDPSLAATLSRSREGIWEVLVHPEKFGAGS